MSHSSSRAARSVKESKRRSIDRKMAVIKKYWRVGISGQEQKKPIETLEKVLFLLSIFSAGIFQIFYYFRPQITIFEPNMQSLKSHLEVKIVVLLWPSMSLLHQVSSKMIDKIPLYIMIAYFNKWFFYFSGKIFTSLPVDYSTILFTSHFSHAYKVSIC